LCIAALAVGVVGSFALTDAPPELAVMLRAITVLSAAALAAVILTLTKPPPGSRYERLWSAAVLLVVAADLVWANQGLNPTTNAAFYEARPAPATQRAFWPEDALDAVMFEGHLRLDDYRLTPEQIAAYRASGLPNLNLLDGGDLFNNFDPLLVGSHAAYSDLLNAADEPAALLRAAGISGVYDANGNLRMTGDAPLAWLVGAACRVSDEAASVGMARVDWLPEQLVFLVGEGACEAPAAVDGTVQDVSGDLTQFVVSAGADAWLVVAATDYPGWTATVDGVLAPIERANLSFRAVRVPEGEHTVTFAYAPSWRLPALALSLAGLAGLAAFFALAWRERRYNASQ